MHDRHAKEHKFEVGDAVCVKDFPSGRTWIPGTVSAVKGPLSYCVELSDGRVFRRHVDHIRNRTSGMEVDKSSKDNDLEIPTPTHETESNVEDDPAATAETAPATRQSTRTRVPPDYL